MSRFSFGRLAGLALAAATAAVVAAPTAAAAAPLPISTDFPITTDVQQQATDTVTEQVSQLPVETQNALAELLGEDWAADLPAILEEMGVQAAEDMMQTMSADLEELVASLLDPAALAETQTQGQALTDQLLAQVTG